MKKFFCCFLVFILLFSICGCNAEKSEIEAIVNMENVRPIDKIYLLKDLNKDEEIYFNYIFITSIINLDIETLKTISDDEMGISCLETIKNDAERKDLWDKTVGKAIYLPESRQLIYKDPLHFYCMYITDAYNTLGADPTEICRYTYDEVLDFYNKYYDKAFYTAKEIDISTIDTILSFLYEYLGLVEPITASKEGLFQLVCPEYEFCFSLPEFIENETDGFPDWPSFKDLNLDSMIPVMESAFYGNDSIENPLYKEEFEYYFNNAQNKQKLQNFINENCIHYKTATNITYFVPLNKNDLNLSQSETEKVKDINLFVSGFFRNGYSYEYLLSALIDSAVSHGAVTAFSE